MKMVRGFSANLNAVNFRVLYHLAIDATQLQYVLERHGPETPGVLNFNVF